MKNIRKFTRIPYGTVLKNANSPMRLLKKLSYKQKKKYKQMNRLFSLELGRALPKRVIWQISTPFAQNSEMLGKIQKTNSWSMFRSAFFGKMWLLNNASAVPGVVWPTKSKKFLVAKMKAFKAFSLSTGGLNQKFLVKNLQKAYAQSFHSSNQSFLWKMASSFDSLQSSFFLKTGFFGTFTATGDALRFKKILFNGSIHLKEKSFMYPGDLSFFPEKSNFFAQAFSQGPLSSKKPIYATKPFLWLCTNFYKSAVFKIKKISFFKVFILHFFNGVSPRGKAPDFDSGIRRFESCYPRSISRKAICTLCASGYNFGLDSKNLGLLFT